MDQLINELLEGENEVLWHETTPNFPLPSVIPSAFLPYQITPRTELQLETAGCNNGMNPGNMNKRLIEFWRKIDQVAAKGNEKQRCFRHMMNERVRREKEKQSYFSLYDMLSIGTKNDKIPIVQTATKSVQELELLKNELERRNYHAFCICTSKEISCIL